MQGIVALCKQLRPHRTPVLHPAFYSRTINRDTLLKLLDLIRQLGPLDTWFYFLKAQGSDEKPES